MEGGRVIETELYQIHYYDDDDDFKPYYWPDDVFIKLSDDVELCFHKFHKVKTDRLKKMQELIKLYVDTLDSPEKMSQEKDSVSIGDESMWGGWYLTFCGGLFCLEMDSKCGRTSIKINIPCTRNHVIIFDMLVKLATEIDEFRN